ncbi:MAG: helix-turn-helix domain-containing protein [Bacteroidota bacterium]
MINPFQAIIERLNGIEAAIRQFREHVAGPATPLPEIGGIELAEAVTGLSRSTLYNLTSAHQIPFYKKAKKLYFKRSELERYVLENKVYSQDELRNELRLGKGPR